MSPRNRGRATCVVRSAALLLTAVLLLWTATTRATTTPAEADDAETKSTSAVHDASSSAPASATHQQTSVLNRLWWRNLEEEDAFIQTLFRRPLASASIGMISVAAGGDSGGSSTSGGQRTGSLQSQHQQKTTHDRLTSHRGMAHHAPANRTGPERRLFIPKLHLVYTITKEDKRALEAQTVETRKAYAAAAASPSSSLTAESTGTSYTQLLRSVLPLSFGWSTEAVEAKPLTALQSVALHSPIAALRAYVVDRADTDSEDTQQRKSKDSVAGLPTTAVAAAAASSTERAGQEEVAHTARRVQQAAEEKEASASTNQSVTTTATASLSSSAEGEPHTFYKTQNSADETLVVINSATRAVVPLTLVGSSYTVVQFAAQAGNTINAVVQLKDHRYNDLVSTSNCVGMNIRIDLRNHVKTSGSGGGGSSTTEPSSVHGHTQPHPYIDPSQWTDAADPRPAAALGDNEGGKAGGSSSSGGNDDGDPDISASNRGSWASFWDSFALMFDTSALCNVLPSVAMRVSEAPKTEPFYVVLRSTTGYTYDSAYYYNTTSGSFYANTMDDEYTCDLDLFIEQWPAAEQERRQFIFAFVVPLLVLLLPLPFTMRRADLVQQYMMETDYAEWVWRPPYYLRNRMIEGVKALLNWAVRLRNAYRQQALMRQLLQRQQQQQHEQVVQAFSPQNATTQVDTSHINNSSSNNSCGTTLREGEEEAVAACSSTSMTLLPPPNEAPQRTARAVAAAAAEAGNATSPHTAGGQLHAEESNGAVHRARTPRPQFKETASALSSPSSTASHIGHSSSSRSTSGSDFDDALDGRCPNHAAAAQVNREHHHHCHRHGCATSCGGASHAVSVHVPFTVGSPVVSNSRGSGRHVSAHDLLFTTAEAASATATQLPQREEVVAALACSSEQPVAGTATDKALCSTASAMKMVQKAREGVVEGQQGGTATRSTPAAATAATAAAAAAREDDEAEEPFCRICREGNDVAPLITPCGCTGSVRFVHANCLDRWRLESAKRNLANVNHCEICKMPFTVNIQRSTLVWESSQHLLRGFCLFFTCLLVVVLTTTLTHGILGELSCLAYYHEVAYGTMFRFEGLSLSLFVYGLAVLLVLFANLIVYSWFRSRPEVEEYVAEMHAIPPFYSRHNMILIVLVCLLLLAQVHAMGFLLKYFLYNTSHLVWSWETSPLVGGILFALFTTCSITVCSWGRQMYVLHVVNRGTGQHPAEDVVIENVGDNNSNADDERQAAATAENSTPAPTAADAFSIPTSTTLNYNTPQALPSASSQASMSPSGHANSSSGAVRDPLQAAIQQNLVLGMAGAQGLPLQAPRNLSPDAPPPTLRADGAPQPADPDDTYTRHFEVPPEQRVIRAFEYCPPRRKVPR